MNNRFPIPVARSRVPVRAVLVCAIFYVTGLFTGAILFGEFLITSIQP